MGVALPVQNVLEGPVFLDASRNLDTMVYDSFIIGVQRWFCSRFQRQKPALRWKLETGVKEWVFPRLGTFSVSFNETRPHETGPSPRHPMKIKVGTQLEGDVLRQLKIRAAAERKPMGEIIQEAVVNYLKDNRKTVERRESLLRILDNPSRLPDETFRDLMEADPYDQSA